MAKIDDVLNSLESGFNNPVITAGTSVVDDKDMESLQVRRRKGEGNASQHKLWYISIEEKGQQANVFWGYKMSDCLKKALAWKGLPTVNKRKPKN